MQIIQAERHRGNNIILNLYFLVAIFFPHFIALAWKIIKKFLPSFFLKFFFFLLMSALYKAQEPLKVESYWRRLWYEQ